MTAVWRSLGRIPRLLWRVQAMAVMALLAHKARSLFVVAAVAMGIAALTVIIASQLGLPVSSTHIAVGGVFGVGFLREFIKTSYSQMIEEIKQHHAGADKEVVEAFLERFGKASIEEKRLMLDRLKAQGATAELSKIERKQIRKVYRHELVKRSALLKIAAAWIITVPISGILAALIYYMIFGMVNA